MRKNKLLRLAVPLLLLLSVFFLSRQWSQLSQKQIVAAFGQYALEGVAEGRFQIGESYDFSRLDPTEKAVRAILDQPFHYFLPTEEDVILIMGDAFFQSVSGYLVTTGERELPELYETGILGLDAQGRVMTSRINDRLYSWWGGL